MWRLLTPNLTFISCHVDGYAHQLCEAETPQDSRHPVSAATTSATSPPVPVRGECKAVVSGLLCGKAVKWEVPFDIEPYLEGREREEKVTEELWNETFHHLAAQSIIQDFEQMAERESEIEHGEGVHNIHLEYSISFSSCISLSFIFIGFFV